MGASRLPTGEWSFGPVYVVGDLDRLGANDLSFGQFADYVAMVSLAKIKAPPHLANAQTILKLFDGPAEAVPKEMSDWDKAFLKTLYHPEISLSAERSLISLRMVRELNP